MEKLKEIKTQLNNFMAPANKPCLFREDAEWLIQTLEDANFALSVAKGQLDEYAERIEEQQEEIDYLENRTINLNLDFFEHLLNCLANQKFISEQSVETQKEWQGIIDKAWNEGMQVLSLARKSVEETQ